MERLIKRLLAEYHAGPNCDGLRGTETAGELVDFMFDNGIGYCIERGFPSLALWRKFKQRLDLTAYGVYVDAGEIDLRGGYSIALIGNTTATIHCDETKVYRIIALHGASANVTAEKSAMVCLRHGDDCRVIKTTKDRAKFI